MNDKGIIKLTDLLNDISKTFAFSNKDVDQIFKSISEKCHAALYYAVPIKEFMVKPNGDFPLGR